MGHLPIRTTATGATVVAFTLVAVF